MTPDVVGALLLVVGSGMTLITASMWLLLFSPERRFSNRLKDERRKMLRTTKREIDAIVKRTLAKCARELDRSTPL